MPILCNVQEAAKRLTVSVPTVRRLINGGQLRAYKVGALLRIDEGDIEAYLRSCRVPLPAPPVRQKSKNPSGYYPGMKVV